MKAILAKLFGAREKLAQKRGHDDSEMPFLEHLEELRQMLVKIIATLIIVTIGAFVFRGTILDFIKKPVELAGLGATINLPDGVSKGEWRRVQMLSKTAQTLTPEQRQAFIDAAVSDEEADLRPYIDSFHLFIASLTLDHEKRKPFIDLAVSAGPSKDAALALIDKNPNAKLDRRGNLLEMSALRPPEAFMLSIKISLIAGIIFAFPLLLFFIAQFVFPGLTAKEKRAILPAVGIGFGLFLIGAAFAYWVVTPRVLDFFYTDAQKLGIEWDLRIGYYTNFVSQLVIIFGLSFELPVVVFTLLKIDLLTYDFMARNRSYAVIIIFTVAAIITPTPDAVTLCLLAVPMVVLYEICIWMAFFMKRKQRRLEAEEEAERALAREKRAKAREIAVPGALPTGTIGHGGASVTDEESQKSFEDNDALQDDSEVEHDYEEGFGPDEAPDPYSDYDFHNDHYKPDDDPESSSSSDPEKGAPVDVDDEPSSEEREGETPGDDDEPRSDDSPPAKGT